MLGPTNDPIAPGSKAPFDLMVDDIDASHENFEELGLFGAFRLLFEEFFFDCFLAEKESGRSNQADNHEDGYEVSIVCHVSFNRVKNQEIRVSRSRLALAATY